MDRLSDYDYDLPEDLIAVHPPPMRDGARMMVVNRSSQTIDHCHVREFPRFIVPSDLVLLNNTRVIRARLLAPGIEVFLVERIVERQWRCLVKPGRKFRVGVTGEVAGTRFAVQAVESDGCRVLAFENEPDHEQHGHIPLPPYLRREDEISDSTRYQTVFASEDGSVAAPTAGLHFTPDLLARIPHAFVTLHVGLGTFQPVKVAHIDDHLMHEERYSICAETAKAANDSGRLVAIGTTVARVLESLPPGPIKPTDASTSIFIRPPYSFRRVDALLTNFHLPRSTLLMLVSALVGRQFLLDAYHQAIRERYRFFSYGDCMLIV